MPQNAGDNSPPSQKEVRLTVFKNLAGTSVQPMEMTWADFLEWLDRLPPKPKAESPLVKFGVFGDTPTAKGSLRHDDNLLEVTGLEGDYDAGKVTPEAAQRLLDAAGVQAVVVTTHSSTPEKPRWRVFAPLARPIHPSGRKALIRRLDAVLGGCLTPESFVLSQAFYVGHAAGGEQNYRVLQSRGVPIDQAPVVKPVSQVDEDDIPLPKDWERKGPMEDTTLNGLMDTMRTGGDGIHEASLRLSMALANKKVPEAIILAFLQSLMREWADGSDRWANRFDDLDRVVSSACRKVREEGGEEERPQGKWQLPGAIGPGEWEDARLSPDTIIENLIYADVGLLIAPGGSGKTTLQLYLAIHLVLGRPLWGLDIQKPGPVLLITAEDTRGMLIARTREIAKAMGVSQEDLEVVRRDFLISDVSSHPTKLTRIEKDTVVASKVVDDIIEACESNPPVLTILDPAISFGVGEARVNDAEQGLIEVARQFRNRLNCAVQYVHHSGKGNARERTLDQYSGRGGSAFSDGARMVSVMTTYHGSNALDVETWHRETGYTLTTDESGVIMARPKLSYCPPQSPIYLVRRGYLFERIEPVTETPMEIAGNQADQVFVLITREVEEGRFPTGRSLAPLASSMGLSRTELREAIGYLEDTGRVELRPLPRGGGRGGSRTFLAPVGWEQPETPAGSDTGA